MSIVWTDQLGHWYAEGDRLIFRGSELDMVKRLDECQQEVERLQQWVNDLQSGMYINCVYCGHRYGPQDEVPATMADVLKEHVEQCSEHPMSALKERLDECQQVLAGWGRVSLAMEDPDWQPEEPDDPLVAAHVLAYAKVRRLAQEIAREALQ